VPRAASRFEPENRDSAEDDRAPEPLDGVRPTRRGLHEYNTLHASPNAITPSASASMGLFWGKVGASGLGDRPGQTALLA
jgi:hypothetical protein